MEAYTGERDTGKRSHQKYRTKIISEKEQREINTQKEGREESNATRKSMIMGDEHIYAEISACAIEFPKMRITIQEITNKERKMDKGGRKSNMRKR